jgi:hypothetical protein
MAHPAQAGGKRAALPATFIVRVGDITDTETFCTLIINLNTDGNSKTHLSTAEWLGPHSNITGDRRTGIFFWALQELEDQ